MLLPETTIQDVIRDFNENPVKKSLSYGIEYLDTALGGILESDLVLIGARSGAGKTELASMIAQHNASCRKNVVYYALEADQNEIHNRMIYREIANNYYKDGGKEYLSYRNFILGNHNLFLSGYRKKAINKFKETLGTMTIIYKKSEDMTPDMLSEDMAYRQTQADLFILDHVHYVDHEEENENKGLKKLTKMLRNIAIVYKVPIVCIAHLRKKDRFNSDIVPDMDEFHGSSDLIKIATKIITLAPYFTEEKIEPHRKETLVRVCKNRIDGSVCSYIAKLVYNIKTNNYELKYHIGKLVNCKKSFVGINEQDQLPFWTRKAEGVSLDENRSNDEQADYQKAISRIAYN